MSHAEPGPLASYNSLQDPHLGGFFANTRMKKHLKKSGLVTKSGKIVSEKTYRLKMAKKEHKDHVRDLLATAIVHKALDMERARQHELRKRLDDMYKVELVKRVKNEREKKGDESVISLLTPREKVRSAKRRPRTAPAHVITPTELGYDEETGRLFYNVARSDTSTGDEMNSLISGSGYSPYYKPYPPATYPMPAPPPSRAPREGSRSKSATTGQKKNKLKLHRYTYLAHSEPAVAHKVQLQSMAEVTMRFLGPKLQLKNDMFPDERLCEVMVLQQHCGGSSLCVFRELLPPNTIFTFVSRRHRGTPFGLTFYVDSMQDIRLSSCCEYKHKPGHVLGGKNGHFQFVNVEGAAPCYRCQIAFSMKEKRSQGEKKAKEKKPNGSAEHSPRNKRDSSDQHDNGENEGHEMMERFEVTITKMNVEDEGDSMDSAVMVDTTTQTPRDDDVTESNESRYIDEQADTTGYTEENKDYVDGAESTKDSGIHQDEDGYDASYADEEFEEDEGQSDVEEDNESPRDENKEGSEVDEPGEAPRLIENKTDDVIEEIEDESATKVDEVSEDEKPQEVDSDHDDDEEQRKSSSEDEKTGFKNKDTGSDSSSSSSSDSEDSDGGNHGETSNKDDGKNSPKSIVSVSSVKEVESNRKSEKHSVKDENSDVEDSDNHSVNSTYSKKSEKQKGNVSESNTDKDDKESDFEKYTERDEDQSSIDDSDSDKENTDAREFDRKVSDSEKEKELIAGDQVTGSKKAARKNSNKDLNSDDESDRDVKMESDSDREVSESRRKTSSDSQRSADVDDGRDSQFDDDKNKVTKVSDSENERALDFEKEAKSDSEKVAKSDSEKDSDKDSDSDSDTDKTSSSDSDEESSKKSSGKESKSGSDAESEKSSRGSQRSSKDSDGDFRASKGTTKGSVGDVKTRPDSAGSGILRDTSKTPDLSDDETRPKKTVSFNEEVKVYVRVEGTGDEDEDGKTNEGRSATKEEIVDAEVTQNHETLDEKIDEATQGDNSSKEVTVGDAEGPKETERSSEPEKVDNKASVEEAEVQKAEDVGVTDTREGEEGLSGTNVHLDRGGETKDPQIVKVSDAVGKNAAQNVDGNNDVAAKKMGEEIKEKEKSGSGSDEEGKADNVDGGSKETGDDESGSAFDGEQSVLSTTENEANVVSSGPSDSETSSNHHESEKEMTDADEDLDPGNDPDSVGSGQQISERALKAVGSKPGAKHEGSVKTLIEDKKDLEIASVALNPEQVEEVVSMVENNSEVGSLTLRNVSLGDDGVKQLTAVLKTSENIKMLNLNVNNIGPDGAIHVAETIRNNTAIKMLLLHGNPLGDQGVTSVVDAILENEASALSTLDIGDCGLGDEGAKQIARLLEANNTVTDLNISANNVTRSGWQAISDALQNNTKLRTLSLDYNQITDEDLAVLAVGFRQCTTLRSVDLEANRIRDEGGRILLDLLRENEKIIDLTLMPMNTIDQDILDEIKDILDNRIRSRPSSANSEDTPT